MGNFVLELAFCILLYYLLLTVDYGHVLSSDYLSIEFLSKLTLFCRRGHDNVCPNEPNGMFELAAKVIIISLSIPNHYSPLSYSALLSRLGQYTSIH